MESILDIILNILSMVLELTILGFCIYYVVRKKSIDGTLLLISSILSILIRPLNALFINNFMQGEQYTPEVYNIYRDSLQIYTSISYILFSVGLILMIRKLVKIKSI